MRIGNIGWLHSGPRRSMRSSSRAVAENPSGAGPVSRTPTPRWSACAVSARRCSQARHELGTLRSRVELAHQGHGRDAAVGLRDHRSDLAPVGRDVEPKSYPATMADVGGPEEAFGV